MEAPESNRSPEVPRIDVGSMFGFFLSHTLRAVWGKLLPTTLNVLGWHAFVLPGIWVLLVIVFPGAAVWINGKWPGTIQESVDQLLAWWKWQPVSIAWLFVTMWVTGFLASIWDEVRRDRTSIHELSHRVSRSKVIVHAVEATFEPIHRYDPKTGTLTGETQHCAIVVNGSVMTSNEPVTLSFNLKVRHPDTGIVEVFELSHAVPTGLPISKLERRVSIESHQDVQLRLSGHVKPWRGNPWLEAMRSGVLLLEVKDCRNDKRSAELRLPNGKAEL